MKRVARAITFAVVLMLLIGCSNQQQAVIAYLEAAAPLLVEWVDGHLLATGTSRVSLSPAIEDLQLIRSRYNALEVPRPCRQMHENVLASMDYSSEGFEAKLAGEPDKAVIAIFVQADRKMDRALQDLSDLHKEYGD